MKNPGSIEPGFKIGRSKLLQRFLNSNSQVNGHTHHGQAMRGIAMEIHATCRWQVATLPWSEKSPNCLLQGFFDRNCDRDSHTHHGIVTCAQEAHHLNVKSACRRLLCCSATGFAYLIPMREACHRGMVTRTFYKENVTLSRPKEE